MGKRLLFATSAAGLPFVKGAMSDEYLSTRNDAHDCFFSFTFIQTEGCLPDHQPILGKRISVAVPLYVIGGQRVPYFSTSN